MEWFSARELELEKGGWETWGGEEEKKEERGREMVQEKKEKKKEVDFMEMGGRKYFMDWKYLEDIEKEKEWLIAYCRFIYINLYLYIY